MAQLEKLTTFGFITKYSRGSSTNFINLLKNRRFSQINKIRKSRAISTTAFFDRSYSGRVGAVSTAVADSQSTRLTRHIYDLESSRKSL